MEWWCVGMHYSIYSMTPSLQFYFFAGFPCPSSFKIE